jgi:phosphoribosylformimino-5-aminoimidazole carboxamide ribotide isomerase
MEILPAIDLLDGAVVRLSQGDYDRKTVYSADPVEVARGLAAAGAGWIHVVDLDAARTGVRGNALAIAAIRSAVDTKIELGGGARDDASVESMLDQGIDRVVVGSAAMKDWAWFARLVARAEMAGRIALGLDARGGRVAAQGWTEQLDLTAVELARRVAGWPLGAIIYTDIARDGVGEGVNLDATAEIIAATDVGVIASGGVRGLDDLRACRRIGCAGAIVGRAYYEGRLDLAAAVRELRE